MEMDSSGFINVDCSSTNHIVTQCVVTTLATSAHNDTALSWHITNSSQLCLQQATNCARPSPPMGREGHETNTAAAKNMCHNLGYKSNTASVLSTSNIAKILLRVGLVRASLCLLLPSTLPVMSS